MGKIGLWAAVGVGLNNVISASQRSDGGSCASS